MGCFYYLKRRKRSKSRRSAPVFNGGSQSEMSGSETQKKSRSCSASALASPRSVPELYQEKAHKLRVFSFSELKQATDNFCRLLKIGEGGFGCVYKGAVAATKGNPRDQIVVAIKKLTPDGCQGHKQWVAEVQFLGIVEHPNLVKLIGYSAVNSDRGIQRLLVYEYMKNKSLDDHLFNRSYPPLCWECRLEILLGAARGLAYLHEGFEVQVIYRDFKASNVLLDDTFTPKLSDFGLAREGPASDRSHVSTAVVGTYGYAAPDYIRTGHLSAKSDVWSYGVVLYEVLTGRRSLERNRPKREQNLLQWVQQEELEKVMDPRLEGKLCMRQAEQIADLANVCLADNSKKRPSMSLVVNIMEKIVESSSGFGEEEGKEEMAVEKAPGPEGMPDSARRRMAQLAKIGEQVGGLGTRRVVIVQEGIKASGGSKSSLV